MIDWIMNNWKQVADVVAYACLLASVVVKITPTLKDDNFLLPIIKFLGKYVALDKYSRPNA